jgi:hypothetical protein
MFVKYRDFSVVQRQGRMARPTDVTAVILNEARRLLAEAWDGVTPIRQVGLCVSSLTHEKDGQLSLFEDPNLAYYMEWDRQYDEQKALAEDARMLAYERRPETAKKPEVMVFSHPDGEQALAAVKQIVREHPSYRFTSRTLPDGISCFEVTDGGKVLERHTVRRN